MVALTHRAEWAFLEFQVGQPFQEFLVGLVAAIGDPYLPQRTGLPGIPGWPTLPGIPGWVGGFPVDITHAHRSKQAFLEFQVGQPFQEFLVGLGEWAHANPTRRNEQTFLEFQVGQPFQEFLVGLGLRSWLNLDRDRASCSTRVICVCLATWARDLPIGTSGLHQLGAVS